MSTYAIGDVQGCFSALQKLLLHIQFKPDVDTLWFTGDLVNRGTQSLEVLRFVKNLGEKHKVVLGNHDLHLIALAFGNPQTFHSHTMQDVLAANDCDELIHWLRHRPLLHHEEDTGFVLTHAGLAPQWSIQKASALAREVEQALQSDTPSHFLDHLYGNQPDYWQDELTGVERLRCVVNYLTRMRFCYADGRMNLIYKGTLQDKTADLTPWFALPHRNNAEIKIIFGHWAALNGETNVPHVYGLDTGCVWGNCLTAMRLEDEKRFSVKCD
jgi:bis(5'-nucleosyl)-tetraphosphatase (symmetrical)